MKKEKNRKRIAEIIGALFAMFVCIGLFYSSVYMVLSIGKLSGAFLAFISSFLAMTMFAYTYWKTFEKKRK